MGAIGDRRGTRGAGPLAALALANLRYWPTVAPATSRELARWRGPAAEIPDPVLRTLALAKLAEEHFNAQVATTLATLAPAAGRELSTNAIVALELLFDYLDGRTEGLTEDPIGQGERLYEPFIAALTPTLHDRRRGQVCDQGAPADWGYLSALSQRTRACLSRLPAAAVVASHALACAQRCAQAQTRIHAAAGLGEQQLYEWASQHARGSGLEWREYASGCASSVLAVHALIAAAANPASSELEARQIDAAYLAICAVITILDSLVDSDQERRQRAAGIHRTVRARRACGAATGTRARGARAHARSTPRRPSRDDDRRGARLLQHPQRGARPGRESDHARGPARAVADDLAGARGDAGVARSQAHTAAAGRSPSALARPRERRRQRASGLEWVGGEKP